MRRSLLVALAIVPAFSFVALAETKPAETAPATATAPAAASLAGMTFVSVDKHEVGRGVGGPAMGNWSLKFAEKTVSWRYSDVVETLTYTVAPDGKIEAAARTPGGPKHSGQYNAEKKEIVFDGKTYKAE